ncbi:hypothetical protein [uncultured Alcanivorax sp.]|jgi:hypothetical protein|uniref:hypothetical protein n=1 Tax=uncultured Alcanivorax sp. TaxID=191215 RepID=UPI0025DA8110|nr:hypothetical protein [uncultured Alcanivorax sp.]
MNRDHHRNIVYGAGGIFVVVLLAYIWRFSGGDIGGPTEWAQFGDYMGGVINPILGFITVYLLLHSLNFQSTELQLTRDEMERGNDIYESQREMQLRASLREQLFAHYKECLALFDEAMSTDVMKLDAPYSSSSSGLTSAGMVVQIQRRAAGLSHDNRGIEAFNVYDNRLGRAAATLRGYLIDCSKAAKALIYYLDTSLLTDQVIREFRLHYDRLMTLMLLDEAQAFELIDQLYDAVDKRSKLEEPKFQWHSPRQAREVKVAPVA